MPLCAFRGKVPIHDTIIVAENKRSAYKQNKSKKVRGLLHSTNHSFCLNLLSMSLKLQTQNDRS